MQDQNIDSTYFCTNEDKHQYLSSEITIGDFYESINGKLRKKLTNELKIESIFKNLVKIADANKDGKVIITLIIIKYIYMIYK